METLNIRPSHYDLEVVTGKEVTMLYTFTPFVKEITKLTWSCSCSRAYVDKNNNVINLIFMGKEIPKHLREVGYYTTNQHLKVEYIDINGVIQEETVTFTAKVFDTKEKLLQ